MKIKFNYYLVPLLFLYGFFFSCNIEKRHYRPGYSVDLISKKKCAAKPNKDCTVVPSNNSINDNNKLAQSNEAIASTTNDLIISSSISKQDDSNVTKECDLIIYKSGEEVKAYVVDIGDEIIKYIKCDNPSGPTYSVKKSDVFMIKYPNGTKDVITSITQSSSYQSKQNIQDSSGLNSGPTDKKVEGLSLAGFILGVLGILTIFSGGAFAILAGILAIIFGAIGLARIKKNPEKLKGKGFAITALICGLIIAALIIAGLALLAAYY